MDADKPLRIEVRYNTNDTNRKIAVAMQSMWREILGLEATLVNEEFQVLLANMQDAEITQVFRSSWTGDYNDAHTFLSVLQSGSAANMPRYANEEYDSLMAARRQPGGPRAAQAVPRGSRARHARRPPGHSAVLFMSRSILSAPKSKAGETTFLIIITLSS